MTSKKKVLAISGSTRRQSTNHYLIRAIAELARNSMSIELYDGLSALPHFNPDLLEAAPEEVTAFKRQLNEADGILICTPEYAHGIPGSLKNAIDWTVSSSEFYHKPTVLITASTDGTYAHQALLEVLRTIDAEDVNDLQLLIRFARTKINADAMITDEKTLYQVKQLIGQFELSLNKPRDNV